MKNKVIFSAQNQRFYLSFGGALLLLVLLNSLVFTPAKIAASQSQERIEELDKKLWQGEKLKSSVQELFQDSKYTATEILDVLREDLPPDTGRFSWALSSLSSAIKQDMEINFSIHNHPDPRYIPVRSLEKLDVNSIPLWVTYAIYVDLEVGFAELIQFMDRLHEAHPYCSIAAMEINALLSSPEKHRIRMTLEWPVLRFEQDLLDLRKQSEVRIRFP